MISSLNNQQCPPLAECHSGQIFCPIPLIFTYLANWSILLNEASNRLLCPFSTLVNIFFCRRSEYVDPSLENDRTTSLGRNIREE